MNRPKPAALRLIAFVAVFALTICVVAAGGQAQAPLQPPTENVGDYVLGEEDEIEISVYGNDDLEKTQAVRPGGFITFPLIGNVRASGRTPEQLREDIAQRLAPYVRNPQVAVLVRTYNSRKISVLGEVKAPGLQRVSSDINVLEALSRAGGVGPDADLQGALLLRGQTLVPVDFTKLLKQGDPGQNIPLLPGDVILVPSVNEKKVSVLGQVRTPLVVPLTPDLRLIEAISRAGGLTEVADLAGALVLRSGRALPVNFDRLIRSGDLSQNIPLEPDDTIIIPDLRDKKVYVLGSVRSPTVATLRPGTTLVEAVSLAGGFADDARTRNILLVRGGLGDPTLMTVNFNDIVNGESSAQNISLEPGDIVYVPRTLISNVARFFQDISSILTPFVLAESGYVVAVRGTNGVQQNIVVAPR